MSDLTEQLIEQVKNANDQGLKLNIVGRNTKCFMGRRAIGDVLNVAAHQGIVSYKPEELVITARAGTSIIELEAVLAEYDQMLSFDPPRFGGDASVGGTFACNLSGPGRPWAGSMRDMVLGIRIINGLGECLRFGGQVMKNVAGFDVSRLQSGAMGCLGLISEVSIKVLPRPAVSSTVKCEVENGEKAISIMNQVTGHAVPVSGACWLGGELRIRFSGTASSVQAATRKFIETHSGASETGDDAVFWSALRDQKLDFFSSQLPLVRMSCRSSLRNAFSGTDCLLDWGGAQRWSNRLDEQRNDEKQVSIFRNGDRDGDVFPLLETPIIALHRRLKVAFDPSHVFNSGRLYGWL